jgi:hypothetical protein
MPRCAIEEDWEDGGEEWEDDAPDDDEESTVSCPYCQHTISEDTPRCPNCENYITGEDAPPAPKSWWIVIGVLVCLYIVYRWIVG